MLTLLSECHFWTFREEVRIKSNDFGAFRYIRQKELPQSVDTGSVAKRDYTEKRDIIAVLKNSKKGAQRRLKDNLKKLEELLKQHKIVHSQWRDATQLLLLFANGIIVHICVDIHTGDILRMVYEKYFVGKLAADTITDAFFSRSHIVLAYNTNQLTVVHLQKPNQRLQRPEKISNLEPRIFHVIIPGSADRKLARRLTASYDLIVVWTKSSQNEVYPWRPTIRELDRANIHVFKLKDNQLESIAYCWSEHDPLSVDFLRSSERQLITVEEKISRKGDISAEICSYEIGSGRMQRSSITSIPTGTQICCFAFSPDQEKLFVGTIDRKICLHDLVKQTTKYMTEVDVIPTHCTWHSDSSIVMIANDRSQFQCFDLALTPIGNQLQSEDVTPSNLLDLSHYFTLQPTLLNIGFSKKPDLGLDFSQKYAQTDCFLLLLYENGPLGVLRFFSGAGMRGDIHNSGLTADVIVDKYLSLNQLEKACNLLQALNWETYGAMCLMSLHKIANYVFYRSGELRQSRVEVLAKALKTFTEDLSDETKDEFSDQVFDLKRRFFFFLLRKNLFAEAFEVALDIDDYDLFMDLYNVTKANIDLIEFSATSFSQAAAILHEEERANGTHVSLMGDMRSESACSQFSTSTDTATTLQRRSKSALKNYVPPLPSFKSKIFNAEMIKINIPKPELRIANENIFKKDEPDYRSSNQLQQQQQQQNMFSPVIESIYGGTNISQTMPTSASIVSTLAALSSKSGSEFRALSSSNPNAINVNGVTSKQPISSNVKSSPSQSIPLPEQTIGIPTVQTIPQTPQNLLPCDSIQSMNNTFQSNARQLPLPSNKLSQIPYVHYASPAAVINAEQSIIAKNYNNFQQKKNYSYQPKFYQHPLVSGTIPPTAASFFNNQQKRAAMAAKKPTVSILSNTNNTPSQTNGAPSSMLSGNNNNNTMQSTIKDSNAAAVSKNPNGSEKNKVKFSDTVQVAVVPDIQRKDKTLAQKRNGYSRQMPRNKFMNPKKELADSLPLCHPNDDYLKDFNPLPTETPPRPVQLKQANNRDERRTSSKATPAPPPSIKVVHFGVV